MIFRLIIKIRFEKHHSPVVPSSSYQLIVLNSLKAEASRLY
jgi:hypothetical protein